MKKIINITNTPSEAPIKKTRSQKHPAPTGSGSQALDNIIDNTIVQWIIDLCMMIKAETYRRQQGWGWRS